MKNLLLFFLTLATFQVPTAAYMPESITDLKNFIKKHVVGPLTLKQQSNAFIEGFAHIGMQALCESFLELDTKAKDTVPIIKNASKVFLSYSITILNVQMIICKINSGKPLSIAARAAGAATCYAIFHKINAAIFIDKN
jgi:hypothetical protein